MAYNKGMENLIPLSERSPEDRRRIASMGGRAVQEKLRQRRTLKEELEIMLANEDTQEKISAALVRAAMDGNVSAFNSIRDTIGEKSPERVQVEGGSKISFEELDAAGVEFAKRNLSKLKDALTMDAKEQLARLALEESFAALEQAAGTTEAPASD